MKKLMIAMMALTFATSVFAGYVGHSEMGPWVECKIGDKTDYVPQHICVKKGGSSN
ncbi:hypothetical protein AB4259_12425 [Vibrio amylolyticus]|uniref:hypothetical protein n=1 Tax=Vibrio amylolyticus TaxID=2847292 RepID=UPI00354B932D